MEVQLAPDGTILQYGTNLADREGSPTLRLDAETAAAVRDAFAQPNGGVRLVNGTIDVLPVPPPTAEELALQEERTGATTDLHTAAADALRRLDDSITGWATATPAQRQDATLDAIHVLRRLLRYVVARDIRGTS